MPLIPGICSLSGNNKRNWDLQRNRIMIEYVKMNDDNMDSVIKKYIEYYNNVENGCWSYEKAYKRIHQVMTMEGSLCYLQYDNQSLVGFLMGYYKEFDDLMAFFIEEIVIFADCHNKGYGSELMTTLQNEVSANGAEHIELISVNDLHHIHFYEKLGYYKANNLVMMGKHLG